jgi:hypothetical protein
VCSSVAVAAAVAAASSAVSSSDMNSARRPASLGVAGNELEVCVSATQMSTCVMGSSVLCVLVHHASRAEPADFSRRGYQPISPAERQSCQ